MAVPVQRFTYGFTVVAGSNDALDFKNSGTSYSVTLNPGDYTPGALAGEVQRAMRALPNGTGNTNPIVSFDPIGSAFQLQGASVFQLLFGSGGHAATSCGNLLGFHTTQNPADDKTGATTYTGAAVGAALGGAPAQTAAGTIWTLSQPTQHQSPITPGAETGLATGVSSAGARRDMNAIQNITDGKMVETIWIASVKRVSISFVALLASEVTNLEALLDWLERGRPALWQPDSTTNLGMRLRLDLTATASQTAIVPDFTWMSRPEVSYPELVFLEDVFA